MRLLKLVIFSALSLFILITLIGLLFPSRVTVIRRITINAPKDTVYKYLSDISYWSKWLVDSTHPVKILTPRSTGVGAETEIGYSHITILKDSAGYVESVWKAPKINDQICDFFIAQDEETPGIRVQWNFSQSLSWYPWSRIGAVLNEKILGPSMDSSFHRLKRVLEE